MSYGGPSKGDLPKGRTDVDLDVTDRVDVDTPATDKVLKNRLNDKVNMELFYNQQITNLNMSWLLRHSKSNLCIVGIIQEQTYGFSVNNQYSAGTGGLVAQGLKAIEGAVGNIQKSTPTVNQLVKEGGWMDGLSNALGKVSNNIEEADGSTIGGKLQNLTKQGLKGLSDVVGSAQQGANEALHSHNNLASNVLSAFFDGSKVGLSDLVNGKFITSVDKVMTYSGSDISITLPQLKTIIFHNPVTNGTNVLDMTNALLEQMAPYMQQGSIEGLYALQRSPGGYEVDLNVFNGQENPMIGTWELVWNGYRMRNLLISKLDVSYSKYNAMDNSGKDSGDPLYAEVNISVTPASMLMTKDVISIMGTGNKSRTRYDLSGYNDYDQQDTGVVSKAGDVTPVGITDTYNTDSNNATSFMNK